MFPADQLCALSKRGGLSIFNVQQQQRGAEGHGLSLAAVHSVLQLRCYEAFPDHQDVENGDKLNWQAHVIAAFQPHQGEKGESIGQCRKVETIEGGDVGLSATDQPEACCDEAQEDDQANVQCQH